MINTNLSNFDLARGFGEHKQCAIELLGELVAFLDKHNVDYFLISGTLLGYCRHNDFIPWDDDMDILVSSDFISKINEIDTNKFKIYTMCIKHCYKLSFNNKVVSHQDGKYYWPFVDIFIYNIHDENMNFFSKNWNINQFFPKNRVLFNGIMVYVPNNPMHFLEINYGKDCMTKYISPSYNHRNEKSYKHVTAHQKINKQLIKILNLKKKLAK